MINIEIILIQIILAVTNLWFVIFLGERVPNHYKEKARFLGLFFAWGIRTLVLILYPSVSELFVTVSFLPGMGLYWIDIILMAGGMWIIGKSICDLCFGRGNSTTSPVSLNIVLLQGAFISLVLSIDAVRTASFYVDHWLGTSILVLAIMVVSSWLSEIVIRRFQIKRKGLMLLMFSTACILILEAFHQSISTELICFGTAMYLMNFFVFPIFENRVQGKESRLS